MSFHLNNSKDITCDSLLLLDKNDTLTDVIDLITDITGSGAAVVTGNSISKNVFVDLSLYSTTTQISNLLSNYTTTSNLNTLLASYTNTTGINTLLSAYTNTTDLNTLLTSKVDDSQVLTNVPSGAIFTDTVYTHPSQHPIAMITGLQTALNGKISTTH